MDVKNNMNKKTKKSQPIKISSNITKRRPVSKLTLQPYSVLKKVKQRNLAATRKKCKSINPKNKSQHAKTIKTKHIGPIKSINKSMNKSINKPVNKSISKPTNNLNNKINFNIKDINKVSDIIIEPQQMKKTVPVINNQPSYSIKPNTKEMDIVIKSLPLHPTIKKLPVANKNHNKPTNIKSNDNKIGDITIIDNLNKDENNKSTDAVRIADGLGIDAMASIPDDIKFDSNKDHESINSVSQIIKPVIIEDKQTEHVELNDNKINMIIDLATNNLNNDDENKLNEIKSDDKINPIVDDLDNKPNEQQNSVKLNKTEIDKMVSSISIDSTTHTNDIQQISYDDLPALCPVPKNSDIIVDFPVYVETKPIQPVKKNIEPKDKPKDKSQNITTDTIGVVDNQEDAISSPNKINKPLPNPVSHKIKDEKKSEKSSHKIISKESKEPKTTIHDTDKNKIKQINQLDMDKIGNMIESDIKKKNIPAQVKKYKSDNIVKNNIIDNYLINIDDTSNVYTDDVYVKFDFNKIDSVNATILEEAHKDLNKSMQEYLESDSQVAENYKLYNVGLSEFTNKIKINDLSDKHKIKKALKTKISQFNQHTKTYKSESLKNLAPMMEYIDKGTCCLVQIKKLLSDGKPIFNEYKTNIDLYEINLDELKTLTKLLNDKIGNGCDKKINDQLIKKINALRSENSKIIKKVKPIKQKIVTLYDRILSYKILISIYNTTTSNFVSVIKSRTSNIHKFYQTLDKLINDFNNGDTIDISENK